MLFRLRMDSVTRRFSSVIARCAPTNPTIRSDANGNESEEMSGPRDQSFKPGSCQFVHLAVLSTAVLLQFKPVLQHGPEERQFSVLASRSRLFASSHIREVEPGEFTE